MSELQSKLHSTYLLDIFREPTDKTLVDKGKHVSRQICYSISDIWLVLGLLNILSGQFPVQTQDTEHGSFVVTLNEKH